MSGARPGSDPPPDDADAVATDWHTLAAAVASAQRRIDDALESAGIPAQWFAVTHRLTRAPANRLPMTTLARELSMTSGGFTKLADRMAREGLIDRRGSAADRRVVHASLSDSGRALAVRGAAVYARAVEDTVLEAISRADLAKTTRALRALAATPDDVAASESGEPADDLGTSATPRRRRSDRD